MRLAIIAAAVLAAVPAAAAGLNAVYLVRAFEVCPGPNTCGAPRPESRFTFETAVLRTPRSRYTVAGKPALVLVLKGVRDETGAPVTGDGFTLRPSSGQVNLTSQGLTIPAGHPLAAVAPLPISLRNGAGKVSYSPPAAAPPGTVVEGGTVTVYDSDGRRLATTGTQVK
jgi:hypothetical protein